MIRKIVLLISGCLLLPLLAACEGDSNGQAVAQIPTATLVPLVTLSPMPTATPIITNTPIPTFTPIPTETQTPSMTPVPPSPTPTPPMTGIVGGGQRINFRAAPDPNSAIIGALTPGDGLLILGQNEDRSWLNVRAQDGTEGWVATRLIFISNTATPFPTATPSMDATALALGTTFPTAVIGGQPVTATPPGALATTSPDDADATAPPLSLPESSTNTPTPAAAASGATEPPLLPVINVQAINQTATAFAGGGGFAVISGDVPQITPLTPPATGQSPNRVRTTTTAQVTPPPPNNPTVQENRFVFALCDDPALGGTSAPTDLTAGSSITIWWSWIVSDPIYLRQHQDAVRYEVTINGRPLPDWRNYASDTEAIGNSYVQGWYVPGGILDTAGVYRVELRATWSRQITDGYEQFGPTTANDEIIGSCTFTVSA